jgi:hypothetical protein
MDGALVLENRVTEFLPIGSAMGFFSGLQRVHPMCLLRSWRLSHPWLLTLGKKLIAGLFNHELISPRLLATT